MTQHASMIFSPSQATRLKAALWYGEPASYVARNFGCSLPLVKAIAQGRKYHDTPWPNGAKGSIDQSQSRRIARARSKARQEVLPQITRTMNARVRAILGASDV